MDLNIICEFQLTGKLLRHIENENTPFALRDGVEYKGWFVDDFDLGSSPAYITKEGKLEDYSYTGVETSIRPAIMYSNIKGIAKVVRTIEPGCLEVEFGEYPQYPATEEIQARINHGLVELEKTGKSYTVYNNNEQNPGTVELEEVIDKDGNKYVNKNDTWYKVSPIRWIVDEQAGIALTKNAISGGIPYGEYKKPPMTEWEEEFERTHPKKLSQSVIRMHELRQSDPTIIEGFLNVALGYDILTKELVKEFIDRDVKEEETRLIEEQKKLIKKQDELIKQQERLTKAQENVANQLQDIKNGNISSITSRWEKKVPSQTKQVENHRSISITNMNYPESFFRESLGIALKGQNDLGTKASLLDDTEIIGKSR